MLSPSNDRLDYGELLSPPANCKLDFAIGTTYSLDLDALVGACIALGLSEETDSDVIKNPICLLEALRTTGDKIALFCEGGQIHLPNSVTPLYVLLEKMVYQVVTTKKRGIAKYPSFHPKFWLIRYVDTKNKPVYKIIVLSRNLTFDRSWDVSFCMEGRLDDSEHTKNEPISDFITYLLKQMPSGDKEKIKKIKSISRELNKVEFKLESKEFYDFDFIPNGVKKHSDNSFYSVENYTLFNRNFHEVFIMSPFLSAGIIKNFNDRNKDLSHSDYMLVTRSSELGKLKESDCSNFEIYTMKDSIIDGETLISEENSNVSKQDIHAKLYMTRKGTNSELYIGSLNASHNAIHGNIEFMICIYSKNKYLNLEKLTKGIFGEKEEENPFQKVQLENTTTDNAEKEKHDLNSVIKEINRQTPHAVAKYNGENYDVTVSFAEIDTHYDIRIKPLLSNKTELFNTNVIFSSLAITQLSEFYSISVSDGESTVSRIIIIPTEGIPEEREKEIVTSVVNDKACFYRYIAFLLGDNYILSALETGTHEEENRKSHSHSFSDSVPALYEKMLQTAATAPERFKEIEYLIKTISKDNIIPEYFEELYNTFKKVVKL